jgi:hypothetical protein
MSNASNAWRLNHQRDVEHCYSVCVTDTRKITEPRGDHGFANTVRQWLTETELGRE